MSEIEFCHLHVHTEYSILDGAARINDLMDRCAELGMKHIAITDHGVMYGAVAFYKAAKAKGIHPIIGCEVYVAPRSRTEKEGKVDSEYAHLLLLAENAAGYGNLSKLVSAGFTEGFYYKPRIDYDLLSQHTEGLICCSACLAGDIQKNLMHGDYAAAKALALRLDSMFGRGNFFLELQNHGIDEQIMVNKGLLQLAGETGIPLIATNDVHYVNRSDAAAQDILLCIQTNTTVNEKNRMRFDSSEFYLKSPEEMNALFSQYPDALANTVRIAERCNVDFDFDKVHLPHFPLPEGKTAGDCLREMTYSRAGLRFPEITDEIRERLEYELGMIEQMGYSDYYLIVEDFISAARAKGVMVGPGRGSAASSLVCYCIGITKLNPLKYKLPFERFLNPERITMPDFDTDFNDRRRQEAIDYVSERYGTDHVCQIITFGTLGAKAAIRDTGRALGLPYAFCDKVSKLVPNGLGMTLTKAIEINDELRKLRDTDSKVAELLDMAMRLEGLPRNTSTHAAGIVITDDPVTELMPVQTNDGVITTQFPMGNLEEMGIAKFDFLGLRTLTVMQDTVDFVQENRGETVVLDTIPIDDKNVYDMISAGDTDGVFQLESNGIRSFMKELQPARLEEIIAGIALYRPGPMEQIPRYIANKQHPNDIAYTDPALEPILDVTYGCIVYQEQVMQIFRSLAGFTLGRADVVRRAMAKKKIKVMEAEGQNFIYGNAELNIKGAVNNGVSAENAQKIYDEMRSFASYAFNKAHAACYALVAYQTGWLKFHYMPEFMAAMITSVADNPGKVNLYIQYCRKHHIDILPPDINESESRFCVHGNSIRFGMGAIKNVGQVFIREIVAERKSGGSFVSCTDFCRRLENSSGNRRMIESLIHCGAFDSLGLCRKALLQKLSSILENIQRRNDGVTPGQLSFFTEAEEDLSDRLPNIPEFTKDELLADERELTGVYISGHPLDEFTTILSTLNNTTQLFKTENESEAGFLEDGANVTIGGLVTSLTTKLTKTNKQMAFINVEDLYGSVEVLIFPNVLERYRKLTAVGTAVCITGRVTLREEEDAKIIADELYPLAAANLAKNNSFPMQPSIEELPIPEADYSPTYEEAYLVPPEAVPEPQQPLAQSFSGTVFVRLEQSNSQLLNQIKELAERNPGTNRLVLVCTDTGRKLSLPEGVSGAGLFLEFLSGLVGKANVAVR